MLDAKDIEIIKAIVSDAVNTSVHTAVQEAVPAAVQEALPSAVHAAVQEALPVAVQEALPSAVHAAVQEAVPVAVQEALREASKDIVREAVEQSRQNMMLLYENKIEPNFRLLAEGHAAILERFEPRMADAERRLDDLETDVLVLKTSL